MLAVLSKLISCIRYIFCRLILCKASRLTKKIINLTTNKEALFLKLVHMEYQANPQNHSFVVGWDKLSTWSPLVKGHPPQPPPGGNSDTPYFGCSTKNQVLHPALDFLFFSEISSRNPFTTTWYQWQLVRRWFR
jgi:hypothetical protein